MKSYFYEYKGKVIESDNPLEVAGELYELADKDEKLLDILLKAISDALVNEYEDDDLLTTACDFDDSLNLLKELNIRDSQLEKEWMNDVIPRQYL